MFAVIIALVLLVAAVGALYLLLKKMGEDGVNVAAPGSCRSRGCGTACAPVAAGRNPGEEEQRVQDGDVKPKEPA